MSKAQSFNYFSPDAPNAATPSFLQCPDMDGDGICDDDDPCPMDNPDDSDGDGVCDSNDICFGNDATGDSDGDGICDNLDLCDGDDASGDSDNDGICDDIDLCFGPDASGDTDGDGVCDAFDPCPLDNPNDSDGDGVCDSNDICLGNDFSGDTDGDGYCDNLDLCNGNDASGDSDNDGVCDDIDICLGGDDNIDVDADGTPDACDFCIGDDTTGDDDNDGVCNDLDVCPNGDDNVDSDNDGSPDACDLCVGNDNAGDPDGDGVCSDFDPCPLDSPNDSDGDGVCDSIDICQGNDATGDSDGDGICDNLDLCDGDDATGDADNDGICDEFDNCPNDPLKTEPGNCGCGNPEPGTPCNDGFTCTINDMIDANCDCTGTNVEPEVLLTIKNESCPGFADGSITIQITGGNPPYYFSIDNGMSYQPEDGTNETSFTYTPLASGFYAVRVKESSGCETSAQAAIVVAGIDDFPPQVTCIDNIITLGLDGTYTLSPEEVLDLENTSDNCQSYSISGIFPSVLNCDISGNVVDVNVVVKDPSGNANSCISTITIEEPEGFPVPWEENSIGQVEGSSSFSLCDAEGGAFFIESTGNNSFLTDNIYLIHQQKCGNFVLTARLQYVAYGGWAGIIIRDNLTPGAKKVALKTQLNSLIRREVRQFANGTTQSQQLFRPNAPWLRLERIGSFFIGYTSVNGIHWQFAFFANVSMNSCVEVGLFAEGLSFQVPTEALFDNVSLSGGILPLVSNEESGTTSNPGTNLVQNNPERAAVQIYPNPSTGLFNINIDKHLEETIMAQVYNVVGQLVYEEKWAEEQQQIDLSGFETGIYLIKLKIGENESTTKRIIIQ